MTEPAAVYCPDPPWQHDDALGERGADANYSGTMSTRDLCALPVPPMAERRVLIMWRVASMLEDALAVCAAWGFVPVAEVVWRKMRACKVCCAVGRVDVHHVGGERVVVPGRDNRCGACGGVGGVELVDDDLQALVPSSFGMGRTVRNVHEVAIIARPINGRAPERLNLDVRSEFGAPMLIDVDKLLPESKRRGDLVHSAKPDAFYRLVQRLYPGPYVEGFSRRTRDGWTAAHSNELGKLDEVARIMRDVWPRRTAEERIRKARRAAARSEARR